MPCGEPSFSYKSCFISVGGDRQILTCSGSGDPELLRLILLPAIKIAGDRPPRYGGKGSTREGRVFALRFPSGFLIPQQASHHLVRCSARQGLHHHNLINPK